MYGSLGVKTQPGYKLCRDAITDKSNIVKFVADVNCACAACAHEQEVG